MSTRPALLPSTSTLVLPTFEIPLKERTYRQQYANLYWLRLSALRKQVVKRADELWSDLRDNGKAPVRVNRVLEVTRDKLSYLTGTIYLHMALKPSILSDLLLENYSTPPAPLAKIWSEKDEILLEDESGRVRLVGDKVLIGKFVTGVVVGVLGRENKAGDFVVEEICYPGVSEQKLENVIEGKDKMLIDSDKKGKGKAQEEGEWIALVSGLELGGATQVSDLRVQLLSEFLIGELGDDEDQAIATKITRVFLAGNSVLQPSQTAAEMLKPKKYGYDPDSYSSLPTAALDTFLETLLPTLAVTLIPGESDPTGTTMPQQALHPALLPGADRWTGEDGWNRVSNPSWSTIGETVLLGNAGQPLNDLYKYFETTNRLEIAEATLDWAHQAPTCPDTLWCYPFSDSDPFIIETLPKIYFIGNQPKFQTKLIERGNQQCRIILLPKFSESGEIVMVQTTTLEVKVVGFGL